jgi:hypothetical protein
MWIARDWSVMCDQTIGAGGSSKILIGMPMSVKENGSWKLCGTSS